MIATLDENSQKILGKEELVIITERIDDVALLIAQMIKMELPEILDKFIPKHQRQRNLSWGYTAIIWLAYILSEGDHRKVSMEIYIKGMKDTLSKLTGHEIECLDFNDDRLSHLLKHLSNHENWVKIEEELNNKNIETYDLDEEIVRLDATTVSAYHQVTDNGLIQYGHSKDDPNLAQIKIMMASLDPMGMPLATDVVSGENADDGLYIPSINRIDACFNKKNLLFVGDCKMSSLENRIYIIDKGHSYLSPLALTGNTAIDMKEWITTGINKDKQGDLESIYRENYKEETVLIAKGYEFERSLFIPDEKDSNKPPIEHKERVLVIYSSNHAKKQISGLEQRLINAQQKIEKLTPERGRGKRQITDENPLLLAIENILKTHKVTGLLTVKYEKEVEEETKYVGRGRGSKDRKTQTIQKIRYQITEVKQNKGEVEKQKQRFGWKAFVTNAIKQCISLKDAILCYRNEYRIEHIFNRLKSRLNIAPLFVKRDDQIEGMTYLLTLGVRVLSLTEFVIRRSLKKDNVGLPDLHPGNKNKKEKKPTVERILKSFSGITLTIIKDGSGKQLARVLTPLSELQLEILQRLGVNNDVYHRLNN